MKHIYKIYFFFILAIIPLSLKSQTLEDLATVRIDSIRFSSDWKTVEFNLNLIKNSDKWVYWADGTIQIGFDDPDFQLTPQNTSFSIVDDSTCEIKNILINPVQGGKNLKDSSYIMTWEVLNGRISITIGGPKFSDLCEVFTNVGDKKRLGRFKIMTSLDTIPMKLKFLTGDDAQHPYFYYQALAYKTDVSLNFPNVLGYFKENDNVEMYDGVTTNVLYDINDKLPVMKLDTFWAEYAGNFKVLLRFVTSSESYHKGFLLERFLMPFGESIETVGLPWDYQVGSWGTGRTVDTCLIGNPTHVDGYNYFYYYDVVPQREETYYYHLLYTTLEGDTISLDTCHLQIPQVIIYDAIISDNPFGSWTGNKTSVIFRLEEESYVTIKVYDVEGRVVATLKENEKMTQGWHDEGEVVFYAAANAQQGLYDIIITAIPTVPMPIDIGTTVLKVQFVR